MPSIPKRPGILAGVVLAACFVAALLLWPFHDRSKTPETTPMATTPPPVKLSPEEEQRREEGERKQLIQEELAKLQQESSKLTEIRNAEFQAKPEMGKAFEAAKFHHLFIGRNSPEWSAALGWWGDHQRPEQKIILRGITRKLALQQLLKLREDPQTASWFAPFIASQTSANDIAAREHRWSDDYLSMEGFDALPPPAPLAEAIDPAVKSENYALTEEEKNFLTLPMQQFLENFSEAQVLETAGKNYYDVNRSETLIEEEKVFYKKQAEYSKLVEAQKKP